MYALPVKYIGCEIVIFGLGVKSKIRVSGEKFINVVAESGIIAKVVESGDILSTISLS